ncbi:MAG: sigma 54-interacting transcriptional regulator [Bacteroidia bacterium]|jgi:magnesium chelatase subunit I|nr:sigma 54-interacting transcriptional regulator [Bacteroidia bacterium]
MNIEKIKTLGDLIKAGYKPRSVKEEMRENLIARLQNNQHLFTGIQGYEDTVLPQIQTAILSRHNMILLGLRGQAKTRIARQMVQLLDEYMPIVAGSEINDDPLAPISVFARNTIAEFKDKTPIAWIHRNERYTEKLATPDVSVADLIGDIDPIKAASLKLNYADERVIHFGLIPRAHRGIFVINELPDLQARIQVSLFNILQEGDLQIRGFKLRLPLDLQFVFTANPEDYTNRGSIVTPLKDRIDSQILTHYPKSLELSKRITTQEASIATTQRQQVVVPDLLLDIIEQVAIEARKSEWVDQKSGVSARLTISALENVYSHAERRLLLNKEAKTIARISDLYGMLPSITGKVELVYEGELEGPANVAQLLIGKAIRAQFDRMFPNPEKVKKSQKKQPYARLINWFNEGNTISLLATESEVGYKHALKQVDGLQETIQSFLTDVTDDLQYVYMEFLLHGLAEFSQLSKTAIEKGVTFKDIVSGMFSGNSNRFATNEDESLDEDE